MAVKVVTDRLADIPNDDVKKLGIVVVPTYVHFGNKIYRDGEDLDPEEFYSTFMSSSVHPTTAAPSPGDFVKAYREAAHESDEIVSIHVTRKHSSVYNAARIGRESLGTDIPHVELVDSQGVTMWQGIVVLAAAKAARSGATLDRVVAVARRTIKQLRGLALLDTLSYAVKGGRISKAVTRLESLLPVKLMITLSSGEIRPDGLVRTRQKGFDRLVQFSKSPGKIDDIAIGYTSNREDALALIEVIHSSISVDSIRMIRLCPTLVVHAGPGALYAIVHLSD